MWAIFSLSTNVRDQISTSNRYSARSVLFERRPPVSCRIISCKDIYLSKNHRDPDFSCCMQIRRRNTVVGCGATKLMTSGDSLETEQQWFLMLWSPISQKLVAPIRQFPAKFTTSKNLKPRPLFCSFVWLTAGRDWGLNTHRQHACYQRMNTLLRTNNLNRPSHNDKQHRIRTSGVQQ